MMILDTALAKRASEGNPIRVAIIGCGFMGTGVVNQIVRYCPGIHLAVVANRTPSKGIVAYKRAGVENVTEVTTANEINDLVRNGGYAVTDDYLNVLEAESIDVIVESTGHVEFGAKVICDAIAHGKDVVNMNAELDATVGPWLKLLATKAGVIVTGCDGDQPAVQINLCRFVESIGLKPMVCGNIKGLQDRYRTPETQASYAKEWGQTATMVTSFADCLGSFFDEVQKHPRLNTLMITYGLRPQGDNNEVEQENTRRFTELVQAKHQVVDVMLRSTGHSFYIMLG